MPKYIGPYKVVKAHNEASTVMLELPLVLIAWNISMKALKQEEPKIPHEDSEWLSKKPHPIRSDKKDSVNCLTQDSVGLKKELSEYTCSDIPQLHEEIAEKYSNLLGPFPLELPPIHEVSHEIPLIDKSKQLKTP